MSDDELEDFLNSYTTKSTMLQFKKQLSALKEVSLKMSDLNDPSVTNAPKVIENVQTSSSNVNSSNTANVKQAVELNQNPGKVAGAVDSFVENRRLVKSTTVTEKSFSPEDIQEISNDSTTKSTVEDLSLSVLSESRLENSFSQDVEILREERPQSPPRRYNTRSRGKQTLIVPKQLPNKQSKAKNQRGRKGIIEEVVVKTPKNRKKSRKHNDVVEVLVPSPVPIQDDENDWNYEVTVKVIWKSVNITRFPIRKFQRLDAVYDHYMKLEGVSRDQILLTLNGVEIRPSDTPESLQISVIDFIEGGVVKGGNLPPPPAKTDNTTTTIRIKLEDGGYITCQCPIIVID